MANATMVLQEFSFIGEAWATGFPRANQAGATLQRVLMYCRQCSAGGDDKMASPSNIS